jgi:hypothetical protein
MRAQHVALPVFHCLGKGQRPNGVHWSRELRLRNGQGEDYYNLIFYFKIFIIFNTIFQARDLDWFPRMRAMSLAADEGEGEQMELRTLQEQLVLTQTLVINLSQQLNELKDQVSVSRLNFAYKI